jgi:uncharacterized repeat protein (TIGR01451 family)
MKRLSVRLSIVAAVIALGGAIIAYNIWKSKPRDTDGASRTAQTDDNGTDKPIAPIPDEDGSAVKPPAKSMFGDGTFRTVSHEEENVEKSDGGFAAPPDPYGGPPAQPGEPATLPPLGSNDASPVDSSGGGFPLPADSAPAPPPGPAFASPPPDPLGGPPPASPLDDEQRGAPSSSVPKPPASMSIGDDVPEALPPGEATSSPDPPSTGQEDPIGKAPATGSSGFPLPDTPASDPTVKPDSDTSTFDPGLGTAAGAMAGATAGAALANRSTTPDAADKPASPATDPLPPLGTSNAQSNQGFPAQPPAGLFDSPTATPPGTDAATAAPQSNASLGSRDRGHSLAHDYAAPPDVARSTGRTLDAQPSVYGDATAVAASSQSSNTPGDRQLEGQQMPALAVEKTAPVEVQVDREALFETHIRNTGSVPAYQVLVVDQVPQGTVFVDSTPRCTQGAGGTLIWQLGTIEPGDQVTIATKLMPKVEGEIGSVAQVAFQTHASVRTVCTRPELKIEQTSEPQVLIGQNLTLDITISNVGSGVASGVILENDVPAGFTHPAGRELEQAIGDLQPGEQTRVQLTLTAAEAGTFANRMVVHSDGNAAAQDAHEIEIIAPQLQIAVNGPSRRYLDRPATYTVELANPGTAAATNVELVTYLPKGMKYVTSDNQGQYDSQSHAVYWSLTELPAQKKGGVSVTTLPIEPGEQKLRVDSKADLGLGQTFEHAVAVEGRAELVFTIADLADPIEVGADCSYEIRLQNRGSRSDSNVRLAAEVPAGMKFASGDGPTEVTSQGQTVVFAPLAEMRPDEEVVYRIRVQGTTNGDHVLRVQVQSDELRVPVTKEEITRVYSDK